MHRPFVRGESHWSLKRMGAPRPPAHWGPKQTGATAACCSSDAGEFPPSEGVPGSRGNVPPESLPRLGLWRSGDRPCPSSCGGGTSPEPPARRSLRHQRPPPPSLLLRAVAGIALLLALLLSPLANAGTYSPLGWSLLLDGAGSADGTAPLNRAGHVAVGCDLSKPGYAVFFGGETHFGNPPAQPLQVRAVDGFRRRSGMTASARPADVQRPPHLCTLPR